MSFDDDTIDGTAILIERMADRGFPASAIIEAAGMHARASDISAMVQARRRAAEEARAAERAAREAARWREMFEGAKIVHAYRQVPIKASWRQIVDEVATKHGVSFLDIISERRPHYIVLARQEAMYRLYNETRMSFPSIGRCLGNKDHSSVRHGVVRHCERNGLPHPRRAQACQ